MSIKEQLEQLNTPPVIDWNDDKTLKGRVNEDIIANMTDPLRTIGYPTQYDDLNRLVGGLRIGTSTMIVAGTGVGKSLFALNLLVYLAGLGVKSFYFDLENGLELSLKRILMIKYKRPKSFFTDTNNTEVILKMAKELENISYMDHVELSNMVRETKKNDADIPKKKIEVITDIIRERVKNDYRIFLLDPLQSFVDSDARDEFHEQGVISQILSELAKELNICILICHHLRKGGRTSEYVDKIEDASATKYIVPTEEGVKGSGKITEFATDVWGLVRLHADPDPAKQSITLLKVLKNRDGQKGNVKLFLDLDTYEFKPKFQSPLTNKMRDIFGEALDYNNS